MLTLNLNFKKKRKRRGVKYDLIPHRSRKSLSAIEQSVSQRSVRDVPVPVPPADGTHKPHG